MPGRIPENILEDILSRVDIVEVISGYIPLKRAGRNFKTTCPFHHEKTASFTISPERQIYHCFGCGESGNAFKFLMRYERMEFPEAVELLAKKAGVMLPEKRSEDRQAASLGTQLYKINELAVSFYETNLNSAPAGTAKNYLLKRGVSEDSIKSFKLGFAPDKWDALIAYIRGKGVGLALLEKAGLILSKDNGGYYDRFRNRLIFPILDIQSRPLGFGARVLDSSLPKYVNSPETPVYTKGRNLYGLNLAKDAVRENDYVAVVEGYLDFIMPYQQGLKSIVASLGTALTVEQIRLLKRYTHNVVMIYDADLAGQLATLRSLDMLIEEGMGVKVVSLPEGFDPDLFVRKHGADGLKHKILTADNLFDYKLKVLKSRHDAGAIEGKARISTEMLATVNKFKSAVLRSEYIKKLAEELSVREEAMMQEAKNLKAVPAYRDTGKGAAGKALDVNPMEKLLVRLMLEESRLVNRIKESLEPADFQDDRVSRIVSIMFDFIDQGREIEASNLINYIDDESVSQVICESALPSDTPQEDKEKVVDDCIRRMKTQKLKLKRQHLHDEIKAAQHLGDEEKLHRLMQQFHELIKKG